MEWFSLSFFEAGLCVAAVALLLSVLTSVYILRRRSALASCVNRCDSRDEDALPALSVIVYADNENCRYLNESIPAIMAQDYGDYEVIVAYYDYSGSISDVLMRLSAEYPVLRTTFVPDSNRNVSIRKLATMLGIKAAKNDIVVLTSADCIPSGGGWLKSMVMNFDDTTGIVVGYSHVDYASDKSVGHRFRAFDGVMCGSQYLASAARGHLFRGDRNNLAYRKQLFFDNKGFSHQMNLKYGDDDIFLKEISAYTDVAVEISPESIMVCHPDSPAFRFRHEKKHRAFTLDKIHPSALKVGSLMSLMHGCALLCEASVVALAAYMLYLNVEEYVEPAILGGMAVAVYLAETLIYILSYRKFAKLLQAPGLFFLIPLFRFIRPIADVVSESRASQVDNYTWE